MAKESKTAEQLSDMIASAMGIRDVYISVRKPCIRVAADTSFGSRRFDWLSKAR
jgi:hypothetical protein